jgi:hypothetical protein
MLERYEEESVYYTALWTKDNEAILQMIGNPRFGPSYVFEDREDVDLSVLDIAVITDNLDIVDKLLTEGIQASPTSIQYATFYKNDDVLARLLGR